MIIESITLGFSLGAVIGMAINMWISKGWYGMVDGKVEVEKEMSEKYGKNWLSKL